MIRKHNAEKIGLCIALEDSIRDWKIVRIKGNVNSGKDLFSLTDWFKIKDNEKM